MQEEKQSYRWIIAPIIYSGAIMMALIWNSIGPMMLTIIEELQISFTKAGLLSGVVAFVLGIFAFVSGSIAGRIGLKVTTCTGITVMAIGCIISGLTSEYMVMMSGRIIFAIGAGLFFPMLGAIIMQWFYGNELLIVNSINFSGSAVGAAVGLAITVSIMTTFGWRPTLIIYGSVCGVIAILSWIFLKDRQPDQVILEEKSLSETTYEMTATEVFKLKETWLLSFAFAAPVSVSVVLPTFLPAYYVQMRGMSMAVASYWVSVVFLIGIPAAILGGIMGVKAGLRKPFLIFNGLMLGVGVLGAVLFSGTISILFLIFAGIGLLFYTGIFFTIPMELKGMTPKTTGFMIGIITCIGMQCGFIAPIIVGWIEAITGSLKGGLLFYGFFGFLMAILPIFIEETGPNAKKGRI